MAKNRTSAPELMIVVTEKKSAFAAGAKASALAQNASEALADLGEALKKTGSRFVKALDDAGPDEVALELNLSLEAEGKWLIVSGKAGATAGVTMTWKRNGG